MKDKTKKVSFNASRNTKSLDSWCEKEDGKEAEVNVPEEKKDGEEKTKREN